MIQTVKLCNAKVITSRFVLILVTEERPVTTSAGKLCLDDGSSEGEKNNSKHCYNFFLCGNDQACSVKMAGFWPSFFFAFLWTETKSEVVPNIHRPTKKTKYISYLYLCVKASKSLQLFWSCYKRF